MTHSERHPLSRLKRSSQWLYGHATTVGLLVGVATVVGVVYLLRDSGLGPNILVLVGGIVMIGFMGFAAGTLLTAVVGLLIDLIAYVAKRVSSDGRNVDAPSNPFR